MSSDRVHVTQITKIMSGNLPELNSVDRRNAPWKDNADGGSARRMQCAERCAVCRPPADIMKLPKTESSLPFCDQHSFDDYVSKRTRDEEQRYEDMKEDYKNR